MEAIPCYICGEAGHRVGRCNELWQNKVPPPERGQQDDDEEDHLKTTISGNARAHDFSQVSGSRAGH
jgi:hypothetical protein